MIEFFPFMPPVRFPPPVTEHMPLRIFSVYAPQLSGRIFFAPPDASAIFLHGDLLCNGTCSVTGGRITYWGGTNGKDPPYFYVMIAYVITPALYLEVYNA